MQIEQAVERIVETSVPAVMGALEEKVQRLESKMLLLDEKIENADAPHGEFDRRAGTGLSFLARSSNL